MRVLQFGVFPPPEGGVQSNIKDIRDYVRENGARCGVVHLSRHRQEDHDEVFYPKSPVAVAKLALTFPAEILHFHLGGMVNRELLALYAFGTSIPGKKTVLTFHSGGYPASPDAQLPHPWRDIVFRRFDRIIGVNQQIVDMFVKCGVPREKARLIPPFALPSTPPKAEIPAAIGQFLESHSPVLLTVGLLEPEYDLPLQIEAMEAVLRAHPRTGLLIIGAGSLEQELRDLIASKPWASSILLTGNVPRSSTMNIMVRSDMLLRTTWYDGDAVSVREALHFGLPVIASDNGMRPPGPALIPAKDRDALVTAILNEVARPKGPRVIKPAVTENLKAVFDLYKELV
jgi:glycosyltransferase involved in cell wall biosynthesis